MDMRSALIRLILLGVLTVFSSCHWSPLQSRPQADAGEVILRYKDFGPQSLAWMTLGREWWQWDSAGSSDPNLQYDMTSGWLSIGAMTNPKSGDGILSSLKRKRTLGT